MNEGESSDLLIDSSSVTEHKISSQQSRDESVCTALFAPIGFLLDQEEDLV
jgi:hypothetical protein